MPIGQFAAYPLSPDSCSRQTEVDAARIEVGVVTNLSVSLSVKL